MLIQIRILAFGSIRHERFTLRYTRLLDATYTVSHTLENLEKTDTIGEAIRLRLCLLIFYFCCRIGL
jgi:hypothetical protein